MYNFFLEGANSFALTKLLHNSYICHGVFVYGTLRIFEPDHKIVQDFDAIYTNCVLKHSKLYQAPHQYPIVVLEKAGHVVGEILYYKNIQAKLQQLDKWENYSHYYKRVLVCCNTQKPKIAWCYVCDPNKFNNNWKETDGDWLHTL